MKNLKLMTRVALALSLPLSLPVMADDHRRHGRDYRYEAQRRPSFGFGLGVGPRPIVVAPAYPVYGGGGPVYSNGPSYSQDPYYDDPYYGNSSYNSGYDNGNSYAAYAPYAPPPLQREYCPPPPGAGLVWSSGFWRWGGRGYAWSPGAWMRPPHARASWYGGSWYQAGNRFGWRRGYWR